MPRLAVNLAPDVPTAPLEELVDDDVVKLLARHEDHAPEPYWELVAGLLGEQVVTTWSSVGTLVEISAAGVTKASTLATVAAGMGLGPDDVVAFGDMPNDLPMLEWAGTSYAMANAHPTVRDARRPPRAPPRRGRGGRGAHRPLRPLSLGFPP